MKIYKFGNFQFDVEKKQLWQENESVSLPPKAADMLAVFVKNHGDLISHEELMKAVWSDTFVEETNLRYCVHSLRKTLGKDYIETVPKRGYRFNAEITLETDENLIGRYKILEKIGVGGMGEVFLANDPQLERNVALKVLLPEIADDEERIRRFKLEAKAVSALNHPNIVTIFDIGESKAKLFIAYEFIDGTTLREKIRKNQLTVSDSIAIAEQVADALSAAHAASIVHRDIKPENIMIRDDGYVKILDFGLAKKSAFPTDDNEETLEWVKTQKGIILGSVQYMSPEQSRGVEVDERTDIWSLGVVLYEMLTGENPFEGETVSDSVASILNFESESISKYLKGFPPELSDVIEKALQKDLFYRYQNINELGKDLKNLRRLLKKEVLTKKLSLGSSQEKTVQISQSRITDEQKTVRQDSIQSISDENKLTEISNETKRKRSFKWRILLPVAVLIGCFLLYKAYFLLHPYLFPDYYVTFKNPKVTRLTDDGKSGSAAISEDKKRIAFVREEDGKKSLIVKNLSDNSEQKIFALTDGEILQPTFAPEEYWLFNDNRNKSIYFVTKEKNVGTLYESFLFENETKFSAGSKTLPNVDSRISFSPDGKRFAFIRQNEEDKSSSLMIASTRNSDDKSSLVEKLNSKNTQLTKFENAAWQFEGDEFSVGGLTEFGDQSASGEMYETINRGSRRFGGPAQETEWTVNGTRFSLFFNKIYVEPPAFLLGAKEFSSDKYRFRSFDITNDGKSMLVSVENRLTGIWLFNSLSKEHKNLINESFGIDSHWGSNLSQLPNGRILFVNIFTQNPKEIEILNRDPIYKYGEEQEEPVVSPTSQVYSVNPDGTNPVQLTHCRASCRNPIATTDSKYIVYQAESYNQGEEKGIWRIDQNGQNPLQLTDKSDSIMTITPDQKFIIFSRYSPAEKDSELLKISIDGGEVLPFKLESESQSQLGDVKFFENGKKAAYSVFDRTNKKKKLKIVSITEDGMTQPISEGEFDGWKFTISPDNQWFVFTKEKGVFRLPLKSLFSETKPEQILSLENGRLGDFTWSKDGDLLYTLTERKSDIFLIEDVE